MKIKKLKNYTSFILAFLILSSSAIAQEKLKDTIRLDEMVVTASKTLQAKGNITQKIEVVSNEDFTKLLSANRNICEVLQTQPGNSTSVLSRNDANWGTYGGIGSKYSTFMLNGLPVDAFVDPMTLDLSAFERIEVQRGPASVMYSNYLSQ
ncbi:MAG TPA: Plug domain-containing protein, partial [Bacteroidales bacterium]|nr:Plug domain-containing protein [Bacteroidales bacterium]